MKKNDAWMLWWPESDVNDMHWEAVPSGTPAPSARTRHTAFWDFPRLRMVVIGGDTGAGTSNEVWELKSPSYGDPGLSWVDASPTTAIQPRAGQTVVLADKHYANQPEIFDPNGSGTQYTDAFDLKRQEYYPATYVLPSGNLVYAAANDLTRILNLTNGHWSVIGGTGDKDFGGEASAMYRPGKVVKAGTDGSSGRSTAKIEFNDLDQTAGWIPAGTMGGDRKNQILTILPNGKVMVTGGGNPNPEIWDPDASSTWWSGYNVLAANPAPRDYHSTALLLPDGRILSAGGIANPNTPPGFENRVTVFSPPYLFDASGHLATRPDILDAPCRVTYGCNNTFEVTTSDITGMSAAGASVALIRPGAVTHGYDQNQRYVPLSFSVCGSNLCVHSPENANIAPPGDYLLFLVNGNGVPSVARWVRVGSSFPPGCDAVVPSQPTVLTVDIVSDTQVWMYWNGAADDAPSTGTVTGYQVRRAGQAISNEDAYCAAAIAEGAAEPASPLSGPGLYQNWTVTGLSPSTTYHLALKARDEVWNWGPVSSSVSVTTVAAGGGGGGQRAQRVIGDASARAVADATSGMPGSAATPMSFITRSDHPLVIEVVPGAGRATWSIEHLDEAAAAGLAGSDGASIIVQDPRADGTWQTRGRFHPESGSARFGLKSASRPRRFVFLGQVELELAADLVEAADGGVWELAEARHSQLGDVTAAVRAAGGYDLGLMPGETLTLTYDARGAQGRTAADCFVLVSPGGASSGLSHRQRIGTAQPNKIPATFAIHQGQPNPFVRSTMIPFDLPRDADVQLKVFDTQGRLVRTLATGHRSAGAHAVEWDGHDDGGRAVSSGVYLYMLEAGEFRGQRKVVLLP